MPDIYNRSGNQFAGSIAADAARVVFSGVGDLLGTGTAAGGVGLLTQSLQISYMQQVSRIYEIGTPLHLPRCRPRAGAAWHGPRGRAQEDLAGVLPQVR